MSESSKRSKKEKKPLSFWCFSLVVVRLGRRFLLVQERKHGQTWYLPAGRVEQGESFAQAAIREVEEESGIKVALDGILQMQLTPPSGGVNYRQRIVFSAYPIDDTLPRDYPNSETLGARWVTIEEAQQLPLRGLEVIEYFKSVNSGQMTYPLSLIEREY